MDQVPRTFVNPLIFPLSPGDSRPSRLNEPEPFGPFTVGNIPENSVCPESWGDLRQDLL